MLKRTESDARITKRTSFAGVACLNQERCSLAAGLGRRDVVSDAGSMGAADRVAMPSMLRSTSADMVVGNRRRRPSEALMRTRAAHQRHAVC